MVLHWGESNSMHSKLPWFELKLKINDTIHCMQCKGFSFRIPEAHTRIFISHSNNLCKNTSELRGTILKTIFLAGYRLNL